VVTAREVRGLAEGNGSAAALVRAMMSVEAVNSSVFQASSSRVTTWR
jgi:hypothetical protein